MRNIIIAVVIVCGILLIVVFPYSTSNSDLSARTRTIEIKEYVVNSTDGNSKILAQLSHNGTPEDKNHGEIHIYGRWAKQFVTVSYQTSDLKYNSQALLAAHQAINGPVPGFNFTGWHIVFHTMLNNAGNPSTHLIITRDSGNMTNATDISIMFTNEKRQEGDKRLLGLTTIKTNQDHIIESANITIYDTDSLYEEEKLAPVLAHELGHALGLGHSTMPDSMMSPEIITKNRKVQNNIGICEVAALNSLYVANQTKLEDIQCE